MFKVFSRRVDATRDRNPDLYFAQKVSKAIQQSYGLLTSGLPNTFQYTSNYCIPVQSSTKFLRNGLTGFILCTYIR